jgi:histidyl-tRNA synthetase
MISPVAPVVPNPVRRLAGMRDVSHAAYHDRQAVQSRLSEGIGRYGYQNLDVPILESTELFLRKSGGYLASQMYSFNDPGSNAVSLRPEFTSAIMRHYLESTADTARDSVVRWQYAGPVFRYDLGNPPPADNSGQFTQVGAELIGSDSVLADAELLSLASEIPAELGITEYRLRLADLDVLDSVLDTVGLSDRARAFIVANMNRIGESAENLAEALERAAELHLVSGRGLPTDEVDLADAVVGLPDGLARSVLSGFMRWNGSPQTPLGRRSPDEIVDRLLRKLRGGDAADAVETGLAVAGKLARIRGNPADALGQVRAIVTAAGADSAPCDRLAELVALVGLDPSLNGRLEINFSLARGIAYYNGIIFDVVDGGGVVLGGGGRYDALALALGDRDAVPALGFAYTLESLLSAMPEPAEQSSGPHAVLVKPGNSDSNAAALRKVAEIRRQGGVAVLEVSESGSESGYSRTITV